MSRRSKPKPTVAARVRTGAHTAAAPRDLKRGARVAPDWRVARDGQAPRLGPRDFIGTGTTRIGRFADVDPLRTPRLWSVWRWLGLAFWAGLAGEAGRRAWKRHGGLSGDVGAE